MEIFLRPVYTRDLMSIASHFCDEAGTCLFLSGGKSDTANHSFLGLFPLETLRFTSPDSWEVLKARLFFSSEAEPHPKWMGFLGYEMGAHSDNEVVVPLRKSLYPDALFYRCGVVLALNHKNHTLTVRVDQDLPPPMQSEFLLPSFWRKLFQSAPSRHVSSLGSVRFLEKAWSLEHYTHLVHRIKEHIFQGDIYQANLSQRFLLQGRWDPFSTFQSLFALNPAPFSAFVSAGDFFIISSSPERFLSLKKTRLETRPIKGTIRRGGSLQEDLDLLQQLHQSEKDKAELLMITDLMRNDLGRISQVGSVHTRDLWHSEAYSNVFHMLSIIEAYADPQLHPVDMVRACFPGGSITGCPKLRAMEIIHDAEQRARGIYTGSIGYFTGSGDFDFNIAIRTLVLKEGIADIQLGGAIVAESQPTAEYEETLVKGTSIMRALEAENLWECEAVS